MTPPVVASERTVLLLGNPNTGKSSIFSALTGARQKVANFPGVTVEARLGTVNHEGHKLTIVDLPGCYSLAARSPDERIAADALLGHLPGIPAPDAVLLVVDASCLERNLYLATQVLEHDVPVVVALTMCDVAAGRGIEIDVARLSAELGVELVPVNVPARTGVAELTRAIATVTGGRSPMRLAYPREYLDGLEEIRALLPRNGTSASTALAMRVLVDGYDRTSSAGRGPDNPVVRGDVERVRERNHGFARLALVEAETRYGAIQEWSRNVKRTQPSDREHLTDRIDAILTHRVWGALVLLLVLGFVFQAIYSWSAPIMGGIEGAFQAIGDTIAPRVPEGALRGLVVDGLIAGTGGVLVFLPQIVMLFFFIALLEDIGYMSRAAFLMDRLMARVGLSGRAFIPLLSSFACAIPGIMGTRVIEDRRSRLTTIFLAPFMSCSARLPVYTLMIGAFVPRQRLGGLIELQGLVLLGMYMLGIVVAVPTAWLLQRFTFRATGTSFLLELPSYKIPSPRNVALVLWQGAGSFVARAGTMILSVSVLVWALGYFPRSTEVTQRFGLERAGMERAFAAELTTIASDGPGATAAEEARAAAEAAHQQALAELANAEAGELLRRSALGTMGQYLEPLVRPLGWDWRIGMAVIASFPAREVVIGTLGTIFNLGATDETSEPLKDVLRAARRPDGTPLFTLATALSIMVFFALCLQCAATLAIMRKETNSWRWPAASFAYMTTLAYVGALVTYQALTSLGIGA